MNPRIKCLRNQLNSLNIEGMIVSNPINIKYLTNIDAEGELLITRKENIFLTDGRYVEAVNSELTIDSEIIVWDKRGMIREDYENYFLFCEKVGFEESYVTYEKYKQIMQLYKINELVETEGIIEKQRRIKDEEEIANIKKACEITDNCFTFLKNYIKKILFLVSRNTRKSHFYHFSKKHIKTKYYKNYSFVSKYDYFVVE